MTRSALAVLAGLFLVALALRPQLIGLSPLLPLIRQDLSVSHTVAGLLNTVPVACMGLFALPVGWIAAKAGTGWAIAASALAIGAFGAARALAPEPLSLLLLTVGVGVGVGLLGALLPIAVKELFPTRAGLATGVYVTGIQSGAALSAAIAVPLTAFGSWRTSLVIMSLVTALIGGFWLLLRRPARPPRRAELARSSGLLGAVAVRNPLAWLLAALFVLNTSCYFGLNTWLASAYVERGWTEASAGTLVALMSLASAPASLFMPWISDRYGRRHQYVVVGAVLLTVAQLGLLAVPDAAVAWALLAGASLGTIFPMLLALPLDAADDAREVGALVALMLGGYLVTAVAPAALGFVRDVTGSFAAVIWLLVATSALLALLGSRLASSPRLRS